MNNLINLEGKEEMGRACRNIGSTVVGLYYLSTEARKSNMEGLAAIIDVAITRALELGCNMYEDKLRTEFQTELYSFLDETCVFIDRYCSINDPAAKKDLASIVRKIGDDRTAGAANAG